MQSALTQIRENYKDQVKIVFKDFPLTSMHAQAYKAAEAARCAGDQKKQNKPDPSGRSLPVRGTGAAVCAPPARERVLPPDIKCDICCCW